MNDKKLKIKCNVKCGYVEGGAGDGVNLRFLGCKNKHGRISHQKANTLQCDGYNNGIILKCGSDLKIRRLTPRECWRLQGFPDEYFDRAKAAGVSDTQLYKQAGNAVTVTVAKAIGEKLKEIENSKE